MKRRNKNKYIIYLSTILLFLSIYLYLSKEVKLENSINNLNLEFYNTNNISVNEVEYKENHNSNVEILDINNDKNIVSNDIPKIEPLNKPENKPIKLENPWHLPIKTGYITNYEYYNHVALDMTSYRGVNETIYPVCDGVVSSMYYDIYGARIVTIKHNVNGQVYTSQYVHLSSYAPGLYVGKPVTINDPLGQMGRTGMATGVHLHITVADCALYEDNKCPDLNQFFKYINRRYNEGFKGLRDLMPVPDRW